MTFQKARSALMRLWDLIQVSIYAWFTRRKVVVEITDTFSSEETLGFSIVYRTTILHPHFKSTESFLRTIPFYKEQEESTLHVILEGMNIVEDIALKEHLPRTAAFLRVGKQRVPFLTKGV